MRLIHRNHEEMTNFLRSMEEKYPTLCQLRSIGQSVSGRDLWIMEISDNPGSHEELEPEFKLIGNMHGNEIKGRVIALALIQHFLENYGKDERITELVDSHRIVIMPRFVHLQSFASTVLVFATVALFRLILIISTVLRLTKVVVFPSVPLFR